MQAALLAASILSASALADGPEEASALYNGRLIEAIDRDPVAAISVYDAVLNHLSDDSDLRGELYYWRGRARWDDGQVTAALDDLRIAAGYPSTREEARSFLGQLQLRQNEITNIPFSQNFDGGESNFVRGWPAGRVDDLAVVKLSDRPGQVLSWRRTVRDAEGDGILLAVRSLEIPERIRVAMRADSFDARLRVLVEDSDGRQWTSSVLLVPSDGWGIVDLAVAELVPADAPASRDRPVDVVVRRVEFRDVTAFHGLDRGENRIFLDDFALR